VSCGLIWCFTPNPQHNVLCIAVYPKITGMPKRLPAAPDLRTLMESWEIILTAENKSPTTITSYLRGVRLYLEWCEQNGHPVELTRAQVQRYAAELIADNKEANTVRLRQAALRAFARWLVAEDELPADPLEGLRPPKLPAKVVEALTDDQLRALLKACQGRGLRDRRDEAIVRLMAETGLRAGEVVALSVDDIDLRRGLVIVRKGKGGKGRIAPFGPQTAAALDRYLRMRRSHQRAGTSALWVGVGGKSFAYFGLNDTMRARAHRAGIDGFHLHLMRHTAATRWLRAGGSESGLMAVAGWSTRDMIDRYTGASASERAAEESRKLALGDI
jgi:site-specific recombinase XerD